MSSHDNAELNRFPLRVRTLLFQMRPDFLIIYYFALIADLHASCVRCSCTFFNLGFYFLDGSCMC